MRVLIVHNHYRSSAPSGETMVVQRESAALSKAGHQVDRFEASSDDIEAMPLSHKALIPVQAIRNPAARRDLSQVLRRQRPDVVHLHNTFPLISASVLHACRQARVPVVATIHNYKLICATGDFFREGTPCHLCAGNNRANVLNGLRLGCYRSSRLATAPITASLLINRRSWRTLVSAYVLISKSQRDLLASLKLPPERVFVKYNVVPSALPTSSPRRPHVTYLGRLDEAKGVLLLMDAWERFRRGHPSSGLGLTIAGSGPLAERVRAWAAADQSVEYHGLVSPEKGARLLASSLAAVVPSQWEETFGLVLIEAMALGTAPVASGHGSFPELLTHGVEGHLFTAGDPRALARVLRHIDEDPAYFEALGARARNATSDRFDPEDNVRQLLEVYDFAIRNPVYGTPRRA